MRIGFVGAGNIGTALARRLTALGHDVVLSNSRSPDTLDDLVDELGPLASAATTDEAIAAGDVVVVTVPLGAVRSLPAAPFEGKTVIDTCNYYPERDGAFPELDDDSTTESELVADHLQGAQVVKAFNSIFAASIVDHARPAGDPERRAIAVAGDSGAAKRTVEQLVDQIGFDPVDAGELSAGRAFQNGAGLYTKELSADDLRAALAAA